MPSGPAPVTPVRPLGPPRPTLVVAGGDRALPLLETPLALLDPRVAFGWWPCSSGEALRLAAAGLVHAAGAHLLGSSGGYNTREQLATGPLVPDGAEVAGFASWRDALVLRPDLASSVRGVADLAERGLRLVNRKGPRRAGSWTGNWPGPGWSPPRCPATAPAPPATCRWVGHRRGPGRRGVASQPAALAYGLGFVPLAEERFDLVIPAAQLGSREAEALLRVLSSPWLAAQLGSLPGYDAARCGERVATL